LTRFNAGFFHYLLCSFPENPVPFYFPFVFLTPTIYPTSTCGSPSAFILLYFPSSLTFTDVRCRPALQPEAARTGTTARDCRAPGPASSCSRSALSHSGAGAFDHRRLSIGDATSRSRPASAAIKLRLSLPDCSGCPHVLQTIPPNSPLASGPRPLSIPPPPTSFLDHLLSSASSSSPSPLFTSSARQPSVRHSSPRKGYRAIHVHIYHYPREEQLHIGPYSYRHQPENGAAHGPPRTIPQQPGVRLSFRPGSSLPNQLLQNRGC